MLDYERFKYRPKKDFFQHDAAGKNAINRYFQQIHEGIEQLAQQVVNTSVTAHKKEFINKYNSEIVRMQGSYKELQAAADLEAATDKLRAQIKEKTLQRDSMRVECQKMDFDCKDKMREKLRLHELHNQQAEERRFLEDQIVTALEGRVKLSKKRDELQEELEQLESEAQKEKSEES